MDLPRYNSNTMENVSYWAYPGMAVQKSMLQTSTTEHLPSPTRVLEETFAQFEVTEEEFFSDRRYKKIVRARRFAGHILFHFCGWSFVRLAKVIRRDRTNMMHHVRVLEREMEVYRDERDNMYSILERLELIDLSSSGNDWYYAWVHDQLKDPETYTKIIKLDAADALAEITKVTHADGRIDQNKANKIVREGAYVLRAVDTVGSVKELNNRRKLLGQHAKLAKYAKTADPQKFEVKTINKYNEY